MAISHSHNLTCADPMELGSRHRRHIEEFLGEDLEANLFVLSWLEHHGVKPKRAGHFSFWGWFDDRNRLGGVALDISGRLLMLDTRSPEFAHGFGDFFRRRKTRFLHVVSRRRSVVPFWKVYARPEPDFRVTSRLIQNQKLYRLLPDRFSPPPKRQSRVRRTRSNEIDAVFLASVKMHREETFEDPLERNSSSFRRQVRHRIDKGRSFVWFDDHNQLLFKADISTRCSRGAQISGVYTEPKYRNRGIATRALTDIAHILFDEGVPRLTLYVNRSNDAAQHVYERLGFDYLHPYQTIFIAE